MHSPAPSNSPPSPRSRFSKVGTAIALIAVAGGTAVALTPRSGPAGSAPPRPGMGAMIHTPEMFTSSSRCTECHKFEPGFTHPVNVTPSMHVPQHLPLENGLVTCITCHEHSTDHDRAGAEAMLRADASVTSMCTQCHTGSDRRSRSMHGFGLETAHYRVEKAERHPGFGTNRLDQESNTCMSCHDGMTASDAGSHAIPGWGMTERADHPIGIPYRQTNRDSEFRLVDVTRLDHRVRLFDLTVGCGSCHSPYSSHDHLLVMSNQQSRLCMSCHEQ